MSNDKTPKPPNPQREDKRLKGEDTRKLVLFPEDEPTSDPSKSSQDEKSKEPAKK